MERLVRGISEADVHGYGGILMIGVGLALFHPGLGIAAAGVLVFALGILLGRAEPATSPDERGRWDALSTATPASDGEAE